MLAPAETRPDAKPAIAIRRVTRKNLAQGAGHFAWNRALIGRFEHRLAQERWQVWLVQHICSSGRMSGAAQAWRGDQVPLHQAVKRRPGMIRDLSPANRQALLRLQRP